MITCKSGNTRYKTLFSNGVHEAYADTTEDKGGGGTSFRPHDLLEAALASCLNMYVRMYADKHNIPLHGISTAVTLDRVSPAEVTFKYSIELDGPLSEEQRQRLLQVSKECPVRKTLSQKISFRNEGEVATGG